MFPGGAALAGGSVPGLSTGAIGGGQGSSTTVAPDLSTSAKTGSQYSGAGGITFGAYNPASSNYILIAGIGIVALLAVFLISRKK